MPRACFVPYCTNNDARCNLMFYSFPSEPTLRKLWQNAINRGYVTIKRHHLVCAKHFRDGRPTNAHPVPELFITGEDGDKTQGGKTPIKVRSQFNHQRNIRLPNLQSQKPPVGQRVLFKGMGISVSTPVRSTAPAMASCTVRAQSSAPILFPFNQGDEGGRQASPIVDEDDQDESSDDDDMETPALDSCKADQPAPTIHKGSSVESNNSHDTFGEAAWQVCGMEEEEEDDENEDEEEAMPNLESANVDTESVARRTRLSVRTRSKKPSPGFRVETGKNVRDSGPPQLEAATDESGPPQLDAEREMEWENTSSANLEAGVYAAEWDDMLGPSATTRRAQEQPKHLSIAKTLADAMYGGKADSDAPVLEENVTRATATQARLDRQRISIMKTLAESMYERKRPATQRPQNVGVKQGDVQQSPSVVSDNESLLAEIEEAVKAIMRGYWNHLVQTGVQCSEISCRICHHSLSIFPALGYDSLVKTLAEHAQWHPNRLMQSCQLCGYKVNSIFTTGRTHLKNTHSNVFSGGNVKDYFFLSNYELQRLVFQCYGGREGVQVGSISSNEQQPPDTSAPTERKKRGRPRKVQTDQMHCLICGHPSQISSTDDYNAGYKMLTDHALEHIDLTSHYCRLCNSQLSGLVDVKDHLKHVHGWSLPTVKGIACVGALPKRMFNQIDQCYGGGWRDRLRKMMGDGHKRPQKGSMENKKSTWRHQDTQNKANCRGRREKWTVERSPILRVRYGWDVMAKYHCPYCPMRSRHEKLMERHVSSFHQ